MEFNFFNYLLLTFLNIVFFLLWSCNVISSNKFWRPSSILACISYFTSSVFKESSTIMQISSSSILIDSSSTILLSSWFWQFFFFSFNLLTSANSFLLWFCNLHISSYFFFKSSLDLSFSHFDLLIFYFFKFLGSLMRESLRDCILDISSTFFLISSFYSFNSSWILYNSSIFVSPIHLSKKSFSISSHVQCHLVFWSILIHHYQYSSKN